MNAAERLAPDPAQGLAGWVDRWGIRACFVWGMAEATLFFIVPDVIVGLVALYRPRKVLRAAAAAIAGALVGGLALYVATRAFGPGTRNVVDAVPFIPDRMLVQARHDLTVHGGAAMVLAPLARIPYKVYVVEMALRTWNVAVMLLWSIPARAVRIVPVGLVAAGLGWLFRRRLERGPLVGLLLYLAAWAVSYANYWRSTGF